MEPTSEINTNQSTIRQFRNEDRETVWQVSEKALSSIGIIQTKGPQHNDFDDIKANYIDKNGDFLVEEIDGKIVGIGGYIQKDLETAKIRRMRTLPEYQGKGIGKKILQSLEESIKTHGYKKIRLGTSTSMPNAIKLYTSMGYLEKERIPNPNAGYGPDFAEIIFEKNVAPVESIPKL
jgi:ribosomal protein S18 acetylase RimI-like enzyme